MAINQSVIERFKRERESENLGLSVFNASSKNPDQQAEIIDLATSQSLPSDTVERNLPEVRRKALRQQIDIDDLRAKNPIAARFLSDQDNASLAIDDIDNLRTFEDSLSAHGRPWYDLDIGKTFKNFSKTLPEGFSKVGKSMLTAMLDTSSTDPTKMGLYGDYVPMTEKEEEATNIIEQGKEQAINNLLSDIKASEERIAKLTPDDLTTLENGIRSGIESLTVQLPGLVASIATKNPMYSLAPMVAYTGFDSYGSARAEGKQLGQSLLYAGTDAAIEFITEKIPAEALVDIFKGVGKTGAAKELLKFGISEIGGEQAATLLQSTNAYLHGLDEQLDNARSAEEMVDIQLQRQAVTFFAALVGSGTQAGIASAAGYTANLIGRKTAGEMEKLISSTQDQSSLDNIIALAQSSKLNGRAKDRFKQYVAMAAEGVEVYVDSEKLTEIRESGVELPPSLDEALDKATELSQDAVLPMSDFAADVAVNEALIDAIRPFIRTHADGLTASELDVTDNESLKRLIVKAQADQDLKTESDAIYEEVKDQIVATGRQSQATARYSAAIIPAYVAVKAKEHNKSPREIYERMGLKVVGPSTPVKGDVLNQAKEQTKTPEFSAWFGNSKVVDKDGEPLVAYHGTASDFNVYSKARLGSITGAKSAKQGFWFIDNAETSSRYADFASDEDVQKLLLEVEKSERKGQWDKVQSLYEQIDKVGSQSEKGQNIQPVFLKIENPFIFEAGGEDFMDIQSEIDDYIKIAKENGNDGIIFEDLVDDPNGVGQPANHYLVFEPIQIKSATGNKGTFDPNDPNILHQFAGPKAETANMDELSRARELLKKGRSNEQIRQETGWHLGVDEKWRFEISDDKAKIKKPFPTKGQTWGDIYLSVGRSQNESITVGQMLDHPLLYQAYPGIQYISVGKRSGNGATYYRGSNHINVGEDLLMSDMSTVLLHEVQHAIQEREDFARGGSPDPDYTSAVKKALSELKQVTASEVNAWEWENSDKLSAAEKAAQLSRYGFMYESMQRLIDYANRNDSSRVFRLIRNEMQWIYGEDARQDDVAQELQRRFYEIPKRHNKNKRNAFLSTMAWDAGQWLKSNIPDDVQKIFKEDSRSLKGMLKALEREAGKAREALKPLKELKGQQRAATTVEKAHVFSTSYDIYRALGGEIEARNTEARRQMTAEERQSTRPEATADVPAEEAIVIVGGMEIQAPRYESHSRLSQTTEDKNRASFQPGGINEDAIIRLNKSSDLSSFLHESGHLFLEMEKSFAYEYGVSETQEALLQWLNVESFDDLDPSTDKGREAHEQFARGFEAYLREGKAPSLKLRDAFAAFARWLKRIYQNLRMLNVELNDDIRNVFDRMLGTEEEITIARNNPAYDQFFRSKEQAGMTDEKWDKYKKQLQRVQNKSEETLNQKLIKQLTRRKTQEWKEEKQPLIAEEKERLSNEPVYQALNDMQSQPVDYDEVKKALGVEKIPGKLIGKAKKGGTSLEEYAEVYGFKSPKDMLDTIIAAPSLNAAAEAAAEQRMIDKYGDILNDGTIEQEAREAVHNDEQAKLLLMEVQALNRKSKRPPINREYLKTQAREMIGALKWGDIKPDKYYRAEIKAAQKAATAENEEQARIAKTQQLVNHYLYKEAAKAREDIDKYRKYIKGVQDRDYSTTQVEASYVQNMKTLARLYDMRKSAKRTEKLGNFLNWYQSQLDDPNEFIQVELLDTNLILALEAKQRGKLATYDMPTFKDLTVESLRGLYEQIKHLRYVGGQMADLEKAEFRANRDAGVASINDNGGRDLKNPDEPGRFDDWLHSGKEFLLGFVHLRNLTRKLDGMKEEGWAYDNIFKLSEESSNNFLDLQKKVAERYQAEFADLGNVSLKENSKTTLRKGNGKTWTLSSEGRVMLALYWGTESSREAIMAGHQVTDQDVVDMLSEMTQDELKLVNKIWRLNESLKPDISELSVRMYGVAPTMLEPTPFEINGTKMTGGHMRLYYADTAAELEVNEEKLSASSPLSYTKPGTMNERVGSGGKKVLLDKSNIIRSLNENIHAIAYAENFKKVARFVNNKDVKEAIIRKHGKPFYNNLIATIQGDMTYKRDREHQRWLAMFSRTIRHAATFKHLGFSIRNTVQQFSAIPIAMQEVGPGNFLYEFTAFSSSPVKYSKSVQELSSFMRHRGAVVNREAAEHLEKIGPNSAWAKYKELAFAMQTTIDSLNAYPTWMAKYKQSMEAISKETGLSEEDLHKAHKKAISDADTAVAESIGSGLDRHLGQLFSSKRTETVRMVTVFGAWFNGYANRIYRDYGRANSIFDAQLAQTVVTTPIVVGVLSAILIDDAPDDDEEWYAWAAVQYGSFMLALLPIVRELKSAFQGFAPVTPSGSFAESITRVPKEIDSFLKGNQSGLKTASDVGKAVTAFVPVPGSGQVFRMIDYWDSYEQGKEGDFDIYQMLTAGPTRR